MKKSIVATTLALALFGGLAHAQGSATAADPLATLRTEQRDASAKFRTAAKAAREEREAKVKAATDAAVKDAGAQGKDPQVAKRDASAKARAATKAEFDTKMKAAADTRKSSLAAARKKLADSGVRKEMEKDKVRNPQGN